MSIKVKTYLDNDNQTRVHPETMDVLNRIADHRDICSECEYAMKSGSGHYCTTGAALVMELAERPDVEFTKD